MQYLQQSYETDEIVAGEIAYIFQRFESSLLTAEICRKDVQLATEIAMEKLRRIVIMATLVHDGQIENCKGGVLERAQPNREPAPLSIDTWARGNGKGTLSIVLIVVN